jgi:hypothetical protein
MGTESLGKQHNVATRIIARAWLASSSLSLRSFQAPFRAATRVTPNPSLKLTRYGRRRKAGPRHLVHHREPALRRQPPRAP